MSIVPVAVSPSLDPGKLGAAVPVHVIKILGFGADLFLFFKLAFILPIIELSLVRVYKPLLFPLKLIVCFSS